MVTTPSPSTSASRNGASSHSRPSKSPSSTSSVSRTCSNMSLEATRSKPGTRSTKGCWTCRLRRKKCDEIKPECGVCSSLGINCHGYGPRPPWMDRGLLERRQAAQIRSQIAMRKGKRNDLATLNDKVLFADFAKSRAPQHTRNPSVKSTSTTCFPEALRDFGLGPMADMFGTDTASMEGRTQSPSHTRHPPTQPPPLSDESSWDPRWNLDLASLSMQHAFVASGTVTPGSSSATTDVANGANDVLVDFTLAPTNSKTTTLPLQQLSNPDVSNAFNVPPRSHHYNASPREREPLADKHNTVESAVLLACHTSDVGAMPFRLGASLALNNAAWMSFLLLYSEPVRELTLALARIHQALETDSAHDTCEKDLAAARQVYAALQPGYAMQQKDRTDLFALEACACLLQVLYIEMLYGRFGRYKELMTAHSTHVGALLDLAARHPQTNPEQRVGLPYMSSFVQTSAARSILGHLIWQDLVNSILFGDHCATGVDIDHVLANDMVDMFDICGCSNRLVQTLHDISALARWKTECEHIDCLDVFDLATRGAAIVAKIDATNEQRDGLYSNSHLLPSVYISVAKLYVQIVVSGPSRQLSLVHEITEKLIMELRQLTASNMLGHVWWVLCITACFANEHQLAVLQELVEGVDRAQHGMCATALNVARECHRMRREDGRRCHWVHVLQDLQSRTWANPDMRLAI